MKSSRVTRGFAWNHLYKMVEYGGVNLYAILVARHFGPEIGGNYAVYLSITGTLGTIAAFAVDGVLLRYLPRIARGESLAVEIEGLHGHKIIEGIRPFMLQLFAFRLLVTLLLSGLVVLGLAVLPALIPAMADSLGNTRALWPFCVIFLLGQCAVAFSSFTLIGLLQVRWVFFASLITRGAMLGLGLLLVIQNSLSLTWAIGLHACASVLNGAMLLYWVNRHVEATSSPGLRREFSQLTRHLRDFIGKPGYLRVFVMLPFMLYGITTWGSDMLTTVLGRQPDILMLRAMLGENARDIGLYAFAAQLVLMTEYVFLFGLGGTLVSVFSELVHADESDVTRVGNGYPRLLKARRDIAGFQSVSTAPIFGFMLAFAPLVIQVCYGPEFAGSARMVILGLVIISSTVIIFGGGMQVTSLVVIGKERVVFANRFSWGVLNLIANYFLIRKMGGIGAMLGTQLSNTGAVITESLLARKWIGSSWNLTRTFWIVSIVTAAVLLSYGISYSLPSGFPSFPRLLIAAASMVFFTLGGYALFRVPEAKKVFDKMRTLW